MNDYQFFLNLICILHAYTFVYIFLFMTILIQKIFLGLLFNGLKYSFEKKKSPVTATFL